MTEPGVREEATSAGSCLDGQAPGRCPRAGVRQPCSCGDTITTEPVAVSGPKPSRSVLGVLGQAKAHCPTPHQQTQRQKLKQALFAGNFLKSGLQYSYKLKSNTSSQNTKHTKGQTTGVSRSNKPRN